MKTPSQRKKGKKRQTRFKTQLEVDIENGFDASAFERPSAANYRMVKHAMDKQRKKQIREKKQMIRRISEEEAKAKRIKKQALEKMKNQTVFDVIDIDD